MAYTLGRSTQSSYRLNQISFKNHNRQFRAYWVIRPGRIQEERMMKFKLIGAAAVFLSVMGSSAMAGHASYPGRSIFCATREPGNPHSKYCDYIAWSKWRQRGAWDSSLDNACIQDPGFIPGECSFNQYGQVLFGAHP